MDEQRRRLQFLDDERRTIGGPIEMPNVVQNDTSVPAWPFEIFLRLPFGFAERATDDVYQSPARDLRLFHFSGPPGHAVFVAAGAIAAADKGDGKLPLGVYPIDVFRDRVRGALGDYFRKEYKVSGNGIPSFTGRVDEFKPSFGEPDKLPPIRYGVLAFKEPFSTVKDQEPAVFQVYFREQEGKQVAIIVQLPATQEKDTRFQRAVNWSLKTLELNPVGIAAKRAGLAGR